MLLAAAAIAYSPERKSAALGLTLLLVLGMAARSPRRASVGCWIDGKLQQLADRRTRALQGTRRPSTAAVGNSEG